MYLDPGFLASLADGALQFVQIVRQFDPTGRPTPAASDTYKPFTDSNLIGCVLGACTCSVPKTSRRRSAASTKVRVTAIYTPGEGGSSGSTVIGEIVKLANADEASWEHVLHEASEKLHDRDGHRGPLTLVGMVLPMKNDALAIEADQTVIADRDAMGVPTEVPQRAPGPVIDVPRVC